MRSLGLDVFRSLSIFVVVLAHTLYFFEPEYPVLVQFINNIGHWGVDFFFVLSGYLIGRIMIKMLQGKDETKKIGYFLIRRWLKTLPNYYLVLAFVFIFIDFPNDYLNYIFFLKGIIDSGPNIFGVSWSLFIEEIFYLVCTIVLYILFMSGTANIKQFLLTFCFFIILFSIGIRLLVYIIDPVTEYSGLFWRAYLRLDAPIFGLLLSVLKSYDTAAYKFLSQHKGKLFLIAIIFIGLSLDKHPNESMNPNHVVFVSSWGSAWFNNELFKNVFYFSASSIISTFLLVNFINFPLITNKKFDQFFSYISQSSYAVYLVHLLIIQRLLKADINLPISFRILLAYFLIYTISYFLFQYFEKPILAFRDRRFVL